METSSDLQALRKHAQAVIHCGFAFLIFCSILFVVLLILGHFTLACAFGLLGLVSLKVFPYYLICRIRYHAQKYHENPDDVSSTVIEALETWGE